MDLTITFQRYTLGRVVTQEWGVLLLALLFQPIAAFVFLLKASSACRS